MSIYITEWNRGLYFSDSEDETAVVALRFYEWNLFDAVKRGDMTEGSESWSWYIAGDRRHASTTGRGLEVQVWSTKTGAAIELRIKNETDYPWPTPAAIVPCLSPDYAKFGGPTNEALFDDDHTHSYFVGSDGYDLLHDREMHYFTGLKKAIFERSPNRDYEFPAFVDKWPYSPRDFTHALMVREAPNYGLVTGIAWDRSVTAQGHNPRRCLHLSAQAGPLSPGEERTLHGRIYLFRGTKEECWAQYVEDFGV